MIIAELLAEDSLQLRLHTPSSQVRLSRAISWCAPTEIMDPTPFLSANVLLLTNGIGLNVEDDRTWAAYVERLVRAEVAAIAFGTGTAHRLIPAGLVRAATAQDVPLLEIPQAVPFLQVHRHVTNVLQAEQYTSTAKSWELAQACAALSSSGAGLGAILAAAAAAAQAEVAVFDTAGSVIAKFPEASTWTRKDLQQAAEGSHDSVVPLPMGSGDPFELVVRNSRADYPVTTLLGPAASIIAVQLKTAFQADSQRQQELEKLLDDASDWGSVALEEFTRTLASTGLDASAQTFVLTVSIDHANLSSAWRIRLMLQAMFTEVRLLVREGILFAFVQKPTAELAGRNDDVAAMLLGRFARQMPRQPIVLKGPCNSGDELRLGVYQARGMLRSVRQPTVAPELSIGALIASTATHGARAAAMRLLAPVIAYDEAHAGHLMPTLESYVEHDCQPSRACASLFIHRNTLSQRIAKLEGLLRLKLNTLEGQAACLMALRIIAE